MKQMNSFEDCIYWCNLFTIIQSLEEESLFIDHSKISLVDLGNSLSNVFLRFSKTPEKANFAAKPKTSILVKHIGKKDSRHVLIQQIVGYLLSMEFL